MKNVQGNNRALLKAVVCGVLAFGCLFASFAFAAQTGDDGQTLGVVAGNVQGSFSNLAKLITSGAFLAGLGFAVAAVLQFKAHKDNPNAVPIGKPIVLLLVSIALLFLPSVLKMGGETVFKTTEGGTIQGTSGL